MYKGSNTLLRSLLVYSSSSSSEKYLRYRKNPAAAAAGTPMRKYRIGGLRMSWMRLLLAVKVLAGLEEALYKVSPRKSAWTVHLPSFDGVKDTEKEPSLAVEAGFSSNELSGPMKLTVTRRFAIDGLRSPDAVILLPSSTLSVVRAMSMVEVPI